MTAWGPIWNHLAAELAVLDLQLARLDPASPDAPDTGLAEAEAMRAQQRKEAARLGLPLARASLRFDLTNLELLALVAALAAELDRKYSRLFGCLQGDPAMRWPSPDLILDLAGLAGAHRLESRAVLAPTGRLLQSGLLTQPDLPLPLGARPLQLDSFMVAFLTGELTRPDPASAPEGPDDITRLARWLSAPGTPALLLYGEPGSGRQARAAALAAVAGLRLLVPEHPGPVAFRDAALLDAALLLRAPDGLPEQSAELARRYGVPLLIAAPPRWEPGDWLPGLRVTRTTVETGGEPGRHRLWTSLLSAGPGPVAVGVDPAELAARFRLMPRQIRQAHQSAVETARLREEPVSQADLLEGCRSQVRVNLPSLAARLPTGAGWEALVLPPEQQAQLQEFCDRVRHRYKVYHEWGFATGQNRGLGLSALFDGPSGTGKTLAAEVLATALGVDAYRIDLAQVVSKYVGETEKNLSRLFSEAEGSQALLFFDEADALFGKRTEVKDAHDRYANIEINYLLQRMEEYDGLVVLATNRADDLDEAFRRRLGYHIRFPMPDAAERRRIWQIHLPPRAPLAPDVDVDQLAARLPVTGGNIRNIALGAAFMAAAADSPIAMQHLMRAARREYEKIGRYCSEAEFGPYA